jgi:NitT/TauT family transport system substrate-binding protein
MRFIKGNAMLRGVFAVMLLLVLLGCSGGDERARGKGADGREKVVLKLNWFPEVEHGGYYAALIHGDYAAEGLDVEIQPGGARTRVSQEVGAGTADFGVDNADHLLIARSKGVPTVALMAALQESPICIMVHAKSGITRFDQLHDMRLAINPSNPYAHFLKQEVALKNIDFVPYTGNVNLFLSDPKLAQQGYVFSEPIMAARKGADPRPLLVSELGYDPYCSLLVTSQSLADAEPELMAKMVRASARGWRHYLEHPQETNRRLAELNPAIPFEVVEQQFARMKPLVLGSLSGPSQIGRMEQDRWQKLLAQLEQTHQVDPGTVKLDEVVRPKWIDAASAAASAAAQPSSH